MKFNTEWTTQWHNDLVDTFEKIAVAHRIQVEEAVKQIDIAFGGQIHRDTVLEAFKLAIEKGEKRFSVPIEPWEYEETTAPKPVHKIPFWANDWRRRK